MHYGSISQMENSGDPEGLSSSSSTNAYATSPPTTTKENEAISRNRDLMTPWALASILSTAFSYGCTMTTFFLLVLPLECRRIEAQIIQVSSFSRYPSLVQVLGNKSVALGIFAAIAGLAQLVSPLIGLLSDSYAPPPRYHNLYVLGKRLPYIFLGTFLTLLGITWEFISSSSAEANKKTELTSLSVIIWPWLHYLLAFLLHNLGLNIIYTVMIALIPDLVPNAQIGQANGTFALLLVMGSLFGFAIFQIVVSDGTFFSMQPSEAPSSLLGMYKVYFGVSVAGAALTYHFVMQRLDQLRSKMQLSNESTSFPTVMHPIPESSLVQTMAPESFLSSSSSTNLHDHHPPLTLIHPLNYTYTNHHGCVSSIVTNWPPIHLIIYLLLSEPIANKSMSEIRSAYWVESSGIYHDFFIVTISRLFYYMGISSQTFFLYFVHDVAKGITLFNQTDSISTVLAHPEVTVAVLAIIAQMSGAFTCLPVGVLSDKYLNGRRKPFVYLSCLLLGIGYLSLLLCSTLNQIMGICVLLGAANGMYLTMDTSLAVDTLPGCSGNKRDPLIVHDENDELEADQDPHGAGQLLGVWGVFGFIGSALGPLIGGMSLFLLGKPKENEAYYYSTRGYTVLFSLSACYFFCAAISLTFIHKKGV